MFTSDDLTRLLPKSIKSLAADLKDYPVGYEKWLYASVQNEIYQGDVVRQLRVVALWMMRAM